MIGAREGEGARLGIILWDSWPRGGKFSGKSLIYVSICDIRFMATQATYEDANLILRLYEIRREDKMRAARSWFASSFRPKTIEEMNEMAAPGTPENAQMRQVTSYFEMVASFINSGVLNKELYFQTGGELLLTYIRIRAILPAMREAFKNPQSFKNLELLGEDYLVWFDQKGPGAKDAIIGRMS